MNTSWSKMTFRQVHFGYSNTLHPNLTGIGSFDCNKMWKKQDLEEIIFLLHLTRYKCLKGLCYCISRFFFLNQRKP